jgi:hypothetical protein
MATLTDKQNLPIDRMPLTLGRKKFGDLLLTRVFNDSDNEEDNENALKFINRTGRSLTISADAIAGKANRLNKT